MLKLNIDFQVFQADVKISAQTISDTNEIYIILNPLAATVPIW